MHRSESATGPNLGQVTRLRHRNDSAGERRSRGGRRVRQRNRVMAISAVFGFAALIVIGASFALWSRSRMRTVSTNRGEDYESSVRVASRFPSPSREQALERVRRAVTARDPMAIGELYRDGAARSAEILDFLKGLEAADGSVERYDWLSSMDMNGLLVEGVAVVFKGLEKPAERIAFLTPDPQGIWQMDFDAFARTVSPSWRELLRNGADQARVRVIAGRDVYYNGPFRDESQWTCYALSSPEMEEVLHGYCKVGTPEEEAMKRLFTDGETTSRVTLELRRMKDAGPRQFEISRVLAKDWILPVRQGGDS
jgi:hypothetical protein